MKLYVVRHGETNMSKNHIIADEKEPLNEVGIMQAQKLHDELIKIKIEKIYVSPIQRAVDTLQNFNINNIPVKIEPRIKERNMGKYTGVPFEDLDWEQFWSFSSEKKYPDCESMADTYFRVLDFLNEISQKNEDVLLVTHGGISRVIDWYVNGIPENGFSRNVNEHCKIYVYDLDTRIVPFFTESKVIGKHFV